MDGTYAQAIQDILKKSDVEFAGVFGSRSKGKETSQSDIDILVRFRKPTPLSKFIRLKKELDEKLQIPVDLVTEQSLSPYMKEEVFKDMQVIYGTR